ncbi:piggyBac transposable element-derived protein 3-like [Rhinichthys klamathensis goyatoka]|uniref:piggyBac transposable element-derived protein 3-like n=1 Tax=Rhinichthys klamathensis goyatoka TaxID=3034132 RepID=UPI0024B48DCE|nr:piggyBac transposable element-derived protein 3-like [Rhinichthys klamathensis goyatoka]
MLPFAVVDFLDGGGVAIVTCKWFTGPEEDACYWPPGRVNISKAIKDVLVPNPDWPKFKVRVLEKAGNYAHATAKLLKSEATSDSGKRIRKAKRKRRMDKYTVLEVLEHIADGNSSDVECMWNDEEDGDGNADDARSPKIGEDRDEPIPVVGEEIEIEAEAEESQNQEDREDYEHEGDVEPVLGDDPFTNITQKSDIQWRRHTRFTPVETTWESPTTDPPEPLTPHGYFKQYVPSQMFELMSTMTNIYAEQNGVRGYKHASASEIEVLVGLHMAMGVLRLPRVRMYWSSSINIGIFKETMSRDRFFQLRSNLHVVNNHERPPGDTDVFFKVRPIYESIRKRCLQLQLEEDLCIDEQIVPFRGKLSVLQYIKGKPSPWGVKMYFLCGKSGLAYDFLIYQGATTELSEQSKKVLGHGASVVFHLCQRIQAPNHKLFFDNYFTTYNVLEVLAEKKIHAAGTARLCRFANPPLKTDKEMSKKTRGNHDEVRSRDGKVVLVKWFDNRSVVLASNFVGVGDEDEVERWDKKERQFEKVKRPEVVKKYNGGMGGVDKLDQLISLYRIDIKSRKWPLRMITHAFDVAVVNSWLEYRRDNEYKGTQPQKFMDLLEFKMNVAEVLVCSGKPQG